MTVHSKNLLGLDQNLTLSGQLLFVDLALQHSLDIDPPFSSLTGAKFCNFCEQQWNTKTVLLYVVPRMIIIKIIELIVKTFLRFSLTFDLDVIFGCPILIVSEWKCLFMWYAHELTKHIFFLYTTIVESFNAYLIC